MARLFLSTDDNAPVINGADRTCLINLLKKCLIEGYGTKQPVGGWTMPYVSADGETAVFRNDHDHGGLGHYLRVKQTSAAGYARNFLIGAYENMTSENDGLFPYCTNSDNAQVIYTSYHHNQDIRPWTLLATPTWMVLFMYIYTTEHPKIAQAGTASWTTYGLWFGDIDKWNPSDNYHSMLALMNEGSYNFGSTSSSPSSSSSSSSSNIYYLFARKSNGVAGSSSHYCFVPHPQSGAMFGSQGPAYNGESSGLLVSRAAINDGLAYTLRGWIPQLLVPLHPRPFENLQRIELDGKTWLSVCFQCGYVGINNCCQALFELDEGE